MNVHIYVDTVDSPTHPLTDGWLGMYRDGKRLSRSLARDEAYCHASFTSAGTTRVQGIMRVFVTTFFEILIFGKIFKVKKA